MKKRNKKSFIKIVLTILILIFIYYVSLIFYDRNFNEKYNIDLMEKKDEQTELKELKNRPPINTEIYLPEENENNSKNNQEENISTEQARENRFEISLDDCNNECENYKEVNKLNYCKQVCGLISTTKSEITKDNKNNQENTGDCNNLTGLEKDYCWRDQAITETNFEKCQKIEDGNVFKQCKNRITEDIIDK